MEQYMSLNAIAIVALEHLKIHKWSAVPEKAL